MPLHLKRCDVVRDLLLTWKGLQVQGLCGEFASLTPVLPFPF